MIGGKQREVKEYVKKVGYGEFAPVAFNPTREEWEELTGHSAKEDSKQFDYLGEKDGTAWVKIAVYLQDVKNKELFSTPLSFLLMDQIRKTKEVEGKIQKTQFINDLGVSSWADIDLNLPSWFVKREYSEAHTGEEELYTFLRAWLDLDYKDEDTKLALDWKKLMKGNVKELREQLGTEYAKTIVLLAEVKTPEVEEGEEIKEYQNINNKYILPGYTIKNLRNIRVTDEYLAKLKAKKGTTTADGKKVYLKNYEEFVVGVTDPEYGSKNHYVMEELQPYDKEKNFAASTAALIEDDDGSY